MSDILSEDVVQPTLRRLPFSFANRFKMVLEWNREFTKSELCYVPPIAIEALVEVKRVAKTSFALNAVSESEFESK